MVVERTKEWIIKRLDTERRRLEKNLEGLREEQMQQPGVVDEWSVKDVLAHLAHWESLMPGWVEAARQGVNVQTPAPDLTWKQLDIFNQRIYTQYRNMPLDEVRQYFQDAHTELMQMAETMPEEEMLERGRYSFTGGGAVFDWLNAFAAHDMWGKTKIRAWLKSKGEET